MGPRFETCSTRRQSTRRQSASHSSRRQMQRTRQRPPMPPRPERRESPSHSAALEEEGPGVRRGSYTWTAWVKTTAGETERCGPRLAATSLPSQPDLVDTTRRPEESSVERSETAEDPGMITDDVDDNDDDKVPGKFEYSPVFQVPPELHNLISRNKKKFHRKVCFCVSA